MGLGWNYTDKKDVPVDKHTGKGGVLQSLRKIRGQKKDFLLSTEKRTKMATRLGFTTSEIQVNAREIDCVLKQRQRTVDAYMEQRYDAIFMMEMARQAHGLFAK